MSQKLVLVDLVIPNTLFLQFNDIVGANVFENVCIKTCFSNL